MNRLKGGLSLSSGIYLALIWALTFGLAIATSTTHRVTKLTAGDGSAFAHFGSAVALDGDWVVVGAKWANAAYLFARNQGGDDQWGQVAKLTAGDGGTGVDFGWSVSLSGETVVVGAPLVNSGRGAAYLFARNQGGSDNWGQVKKLTATDGAAGDGFGRSVQLAGDHVVVGAPGVDVDGNNDQGVVYLFARNEGGNDQWNLVKKLTALDGSADDEFGFAVGMSGARIVVGAPSAGVSSFSDGAAYLFAQNQGGSGNWGEVTKLSAADGASHNQFGWSVAIHGDTVVVGALRGDGENGDEGAVYLFRRNQDNDEDWPLEAKLTASDGLVEDFFGTSSAVYSDSVLIGSWRAIIEGQPDQGAAYLFQRHQGGSNHWGQFAKLTAPDGAGFDGLGWSVALNRQTALAGAFLANVGSNSDQGAAYLYPRPILLPYYLPLILKGYPPAPPTPTPTPTFPCAPQHLTDIPVGNQPRGLTVDEARVRVYVANYAGSSISIIDGHRNAVISTVTHFPHISAPTGIVYDPANDMIWTANSGSDNTGNFYWLTPINAGTLSVGAPLPLAQEPGGLAFNPVDQHLYLTHPTHNTVSVISPTQASLINTIAVGQRPINLAVHRHTGLVYVANFDSRSVSVLNKSGLLFEIPLAFDSDQPFGVAVDDVLDNVVYVSTVKSFRLETIDIDNNHQVLPWHEIRRSNGQGVPLRALALNLTLDTADGGHLWTTTSTGDMGSATQILLIPKGYRSGFSLPIPNNYADPTGGGLLAAGISINTQLDRTYISLPASGAVRVFGDRDGGCTQPFKPGHGLLITSEP